MEAQSSYYYDDILTTGSGMRAETTTRFMQLVESEYPQLAAIDRYVTIPIVIFGIIGNIISAIIWSTTIVSRRNSSAYFLVALSINDLAFLSMALIFDIHWAWDLRILDYNIACELFSLFYIIPQYASPAIVLAFSIDRYLFVCHPFWRRRFSNYTFVSTFLTAIFGSAFVCALPEAFFWTVTNGQQCTNREGAQQFLFAWGIFTNAFYCLAIPLINLAINVNLIREIISLSRRDQNQTGAGSMAPHGSQTSLENLQNDEIVLRKHSKKPPGQHVSFINHCVFF